MYYIVLQLKQLLWPDNSNLRRTKLMNRLNVKVKIFSTLLYTFLVI